MSSDNLMGVAWASGVFEKKNVTSLVTSKVWKEQKSDLFALLLCCFTARIRARRAASWTTRYLSFKNFLGAIPSKFTLDNSQVSTMEMESLQEVEK